MTQTRRFGKRPTLPSTAPIAHELLGFRAREAERGQSQDAVHTSGSNHLYAVGQLVAFRPDIATSFSKFTGTYRVKARMPPLGDSFQYRIKSDAEQFERVVLEHQLSAVNSAPG